jgi:hypothetical protein
MNFGSDLRNAHSFLDAPASDTAQHSTAQLDSGGLVRPDQVYACREAFSSRVLDATIHAPWHVCATQIAHVPSHRLVTFGMEDQAVGCWRMPAGCWAGPRQASALSFERIRDVLCVVDECPGLEVRLNRFALRLTLLLRKSRISTAVTCQSLLLVTQYHHSGGVLVGEWLFGQPS